jgi:hypothetical protein
MVIEKAEKGPKSGSEEKEHFLISSGWNGAVWLYRLDDGEDVTPHFQKLVPKNSKTPLDEIISVAFHAPSTLITGRRDGHLLVWNTITYALLADHYLDEGTRIKDISLIEPQISRQIIAATGINSQTTAAASWSPQNPAAVDRGGSGRRGGAHSILRVASAAAAPVSREPGETGGGLAGMGSRRLSGSRWLRARSKEGGGREGGGAACHIHNGIPKPTSPRAQLAQQGGGGEGKAKRRPPQLMINASQLTLQQSITASTKTQRFSAAVEENLEWAQLDRLLQAAALKNAAGASGGAAAVKGVVFHQLDYVSFDGFKDVAVAACSDGMWRFFKGRKQVFWGWAQGRSTLAAPPSLPTVLGSRWEAYGYCVCVCVCVCIMYVYICLYIEMCVCVRVSTPSLSHKHTHKQTRTHTGTRRRRARSW